MITPFPRANRCVLAILVVVFATSACARASQTQTNSGPGITTASSVADTTPPAPFTTTAVATSTTGTEPTTTTTDPYSRPDWLGTRPLPLRPDGLGEVQPTPPELQHRAFETIDLLPAPNGSTFASTVGPVPQDVLARSTWTDECPVTLDELAYITVSHWGFDQEFHTGEMIVNVDDADDIVNVFRKLHDARFPIEQMRVASVGDLDAAPTGDGNETGAFVCRPAVGSTSWSRHAYGAAIDIDPFQNPYVKGDIVIPELASYYTDRTLDDAGVIHSGDVVVQAFAEIGWGWGGEWNSLKDYQHFSDTGT